VIPLGRTRLAIGCLLALGGGACLATQAQSADPARAAAAAPAQTEITIREFMFSPRSLTVAVGTTVQWKNLDGEPHTIHSVDELFRSGPLDESDAFSFKFDKPGTYRYVCSIHPQMVGTIVVK